jgi:hypothetical protein
LGRSNLVSPTLCTDLFLIKWHTCLTTSLRKIFFCLREIQYQIDIHICLFIVRPEKLSEIQ